MNAVPSAVRTNEAPPSGWALLKPYLFDIVGPFVAYLIVHWFGAAGIWAMTAAGSVASLSTIINSIRRRKLDGVGVLVLLEIVASLAVMIWVRDPRLMLIRPSFYSAIAAVYLWFSMFVGRPLTYFGARVMVARRGPARLAAYERTWNTSAAFRRLHRIVTCSFGVCLAVDSVLRIVIVYHANLDRAAWLSNVPHVTAMVLMMIASALAGRRFKRYVETEMASAHPIGADRPDASS